MDYIDEFIDKNLSEKRKKHTYGVAETAVKLARRYGADEEKADIAARLHDVYRNISGGQLDEYIEKLNLDEKYRGNINLAHGKIAAELIPEAFGIKDIEILGAVAYHTTGKADMTMLEKIIYLADACEPGREYDGVDMIRALAEEDLDKACLETLIHTRDYVIKQGQYLDEDTIKAIEWLEKKQKEELMKNPREIAMFGAKILDSKKAVDIVVIDVSAKASFADFILLASGLNERQIGALAEDLDDAYSKNEIFVKNIEGKKDSGWILMDYGDIIINILSKDMRAKYNIEKVWGDCDFINFEEEIQA